MGINAKIVLITSGQPALNPRLIKEADLLVEAGYEVTVLYQYWNDWATELEQALLPQKKWTAIQVGGSPKTQATLFFYTRIRFKLIRLMYKYFKLFPDAAVARSSYLLFSCAKKYPAILYIAHNLGALPIAFKAAKFHQAKCGFDAEDFHRYENSNDLNHPMVKLNTLIEDKYFPQMNYLTASSPLTSAAYAKIFNRPCPVILNVIPKTKYLHSVTNNTTLKIFWFSQTIGKNRGLETIIEALNLSENRFELHLLGQVNHLYAERLIKLFKNNKSQLYFHSPISPDELPSFASQFDIGIASEPGFSTNNNYALSNKIFTYIQTGIATVASDTPAQKDLLTKHRGIGELYANNNPHDLARIFDKYNTNRTLLAQHKSFAFNLGQNVLNWEVEGKKFLSIVQSTIPLIGKTPL